MQHDDDTWFDLDFREVSSDEVPLSVMKRINETKKLSIHDFFDLRSALPKDKTIDQMREMAFEEKLDWIVMYMPSSPANKELDAAVYHVFGSPANKAKERLKDKLLIS